jgi:HEAT repeat protein
MLAHSFAMGAATVFFETAASALFLARFGASTLPYVYLAAALLNTATGLVYTRVQDRVPFARLMKGTLWFLLVSVAALRVGLGMSAAAWLIFLLLVWYRALSILTDLEYWAVAARLYDVRQAKRLFGIVGSGEVVARIAGAFAVPLIVHAFGVARLVDFSAVALAACLVLVSLVLRAVPAAGERPGAAGAAPVLRPGLRGLLAEPYLRVIILLAFFGVLAKYLVDYAFLAQMRTRYADAQNLATFFALFSGFSQAASLLTRVFLSGPLLSRFGVRTGLTVLPAAHLACTALIVASGLLPAAAGMVFWLVISNQAIYKILKHPIDNPSFKVLYQPLRKDQRLATQIAVETLVTPLTIGLAGALMLLLSRSVPGGPVVFAWVMLAVFGAWVIMAKGAGREYAAALVRALKRRFVDDDEPFSYDDPRSLAVLHHTLGSERPEDVLFALALLEKAGAPGLEPAVIRLADHPSPDVRRAALRRLQDSPAPAARARIRAHAETDPVPAVRAVAMRAVCRGAGREGTALAVAALDDPSPEVRRGALVGLLESGEDAARARLAALASSPAPSDRAGAARVAGEVAHPGSVALLSALLADRSPVVRRAAVAAAGRARDRTLWPSVLDALGDHRLRGAAMAALALGGPDVTEVLAPCLQGAAASPVARAAASVLGRVRGPHAQEALRAYVGYPDPIVRLEVLESLRLSGYAPPADSREATAVRRQLEEQLDDAAWAMAVLRDLPPEPALVVLRAALARELGLGRQSILLLLSFLHDPVAVLRARVGLAHGSREKRAYALEVLDVTLGADLKPRVLALLEGPDTVGESAPLGEASPPGPGPAASRVKEVALRPRASVSAWTTACAVQAAAHLGGAGWGDVLDHVEGDASALVRETARWARARLEGGIESGGGGRMLTIERVICLKAVPMFAGVSEETLADVAELLAEVEYAKGQVVFEKGAEGDSLYIVVSGRVRVYDGPRTIVELGPKEIFGELALLDPEPRLASIAAVEHTRLFRLDRESFAELMAGNIEVVRGVLHVLCERLRAKGGYAGDRVALDSAGR